MSDQEKKGFIKLNDGGLYVTTCAKGELVTSNTPVDLHRLEHFLSHRSRYWLDKYQPKLMVVQTIVNLVEVEI